MKTINFDREKITLEFTAEEFRDLRRALVTVDHEYAGLDEVMLRVPRERISALCEALGEVLDAKAQRYTTDSLPDA